MIPFLPGEKRQFGFILSAPPEVQQNATPYVTVGSLAFTQIPAPLPKLDAQATKRRIQPISPSTPLISPAATSAASSSAPSLVAFARSPERCVMTITVIVSLLVESLTIATCQFESR